MALNNKIRVTNFAAANTINFSTRQSVAKPASWSAAKGPQCMTVGNGAFICVGVNFSTTTTEILRSTDFDNWSTITVPAIDIVQNNGEYCRQTATDGNGNWVIVSGWNANSTACIVSSNNGASWSSGGALPSSRAWTYCAYGSGTTYMAINYNSAKVALTTNSGASWSAKTDLSLSFASVCYGGGRWIALGNSTGTTIQHSDDNGATWSATRSTNVEAFLCIKYINGRFYGIGNNGGIYTSNNAGITWSAVVDLGTTGGYSSLSSTKIGDFYYQTIDQFIRSSKDYISWNSKADLSGDNTVCSPSNDTLSYYIADGDATNLNYVPAYNVNGTAGLYYSRGTIVVNDGESSYIDVTATKGTTTRTIRVPVTKGVYQQDINTINVFPGAIILPATLDGVVNPAAYSSAISNIYVYTNGVDSTSSWTISKTDGTSVTSTLTSSAITVTSLNTNVDTGTISIVATNTTSGKVLNYSLVVYKSKGGALSGIHVGSGFSGFSTSQTAIYLKFLTSGYFQIKQGSGGTYANAGMWYNPPNTITPAGGSYYMILDYTSTTSDTLTAGTNGVIGGTTWNQLNVDREFYLSNAASGTHSVDLLVKLATSNTGANAVIGGGKLELRVP